MECCIRRSVSNAPHTCKALYVPFNQVAYDASNNTYYTTTIFNLGEKKQTYPGESDHIIESQPETNTNILQPHATKHTFFGNLYAQSTNRKLELYSMHSTCFLRMLNPKKKKKRVIESRNMTDKFSSAAFSPDSNFYVLSFLGRLKLYTWTPGQPQARNASNSSSYTDTQSSDNPKKYWHRTKRIKQKSSIQLLCALYPGRFDTPIESTSVGPDGLSIAFTNGNDIGIVSIKSVIENNFFELEKGCKFLEKPILQLLLEYNQKKDQ